MDTALYFPYMRVPETPWFSQVLLYWDEVAVIVPSGATNLSPFMRGLQDVEMLKLINPDSDFPELSSAIFADGFFQILGNRTGGARTKCTSPIHTGKMTWSIFSELAKRGLAVLDHFGYRVEANTADLYMAYLASVMSGLRASMLPVTDRRASMATFDSSNRPLEVRLAALRYVVVTEALPTPRGQVAPSELRSFKDQNADKLRRCRHHLDGVLAELADIEDAEMKRVRLLSASSAIADDVATLQEEMDRRRWPGVVLGGFGAIAGAVLGAAAAAAAGGSALAMGLGASAGIAQAGAAAYATWEQMSAQKVDPRAPMAYAALAAKI